MSSLERALPLHISDKYLHVFLYNFCGFIFKSLIFVSLEIHFHIRNELEI